MTADLIAFLASCHDEDERVAREASESDYPAVYETRVLGPTVNFGGPSGIARQAARKAHAARHDPQSVLARVEAERALVALHEPIEHSVIVGPREQVSVIKCSGCTDETSNDWTEHPCPTLRVLAWGYRHRPGWQESWRPAGMEARTDA